MSEETYRLIFIFDETETYIDSDLEFPNIQRRVLYDLVVDYVELTQTIDEFTELLRCIYNYTKDSMPILDRTYLKSKIITIMTDNIFKAFGIEKIKGLKIQLDPNYDEKIVQFCEEITAYEFDDIITSKQKGISKYSFTDYKINKCSSFILAAYTDTMYKVSLFISYQYYLDPNTQDNIMGKMRSKIDDDSHACFNVLLEPTYSDIHLNYEFRSVFSDDISATELKKWFLVNRMVRGEIIMYVNYSTLHILNCIEEHIKRSSCEENVTSEQNLFRILCKISSLRELKKFYDTLLPEFDFDNLIFRYREITRYEKFFVIYKHEVTEDSLSRWQEYMELVDKKIDEIDRFVNEPIPRDDPEGNM